MRKISEGRRYPLLMLALAAIVAANCTFGVIYSAEHHHGLRLWAAILLNILAAAWILWAMWDSYRRDLRNEQG